MKCPPAPSRKAAQEEGFRSEQVRDGHHVPVLAAQRRLANAGRARPSSLPGEDPADDREEVCAFFMTEETFSHEENSEFCFFEAQKKTSREPNHRRTVV